MTPAEAQELLAKLIKMREDLYKTGVKPRRHSPYFEREPKPADENTPTKEQEK